MKFFLIYIFIYLFISCPQVLSQWFIQPSGQTENLTSIWVINENTAYITTAYNIIKTTDGGTSWVQNFNPPAEMNDIQFLNPNTGFAIGAGVNGVVLYKTTNAGTTWNLNGTLPFGNGYYKFHFMNENTGVAATFGGIYKTINGGANWTNNHPGVANYNNVFFLDDNNGWATTDAGNIARTPNGGDYWSEFYVCSGCPLNSVFMLSNYVGFLINNNSRIYRSTTGGNYWPEYSNIGIPSCELNAMYFINLATGWVTGCQGTIYITSNGGLSWTQQSIGTTSKFFDIQFANSLTGWAVGANGRILKTTSGGLTFIEPVSNEVPSAFSLSQNYPNPFNPSTKIQFALPKSSFAKLVVYDALGRELETLVNEQLNAGIYEADWNADKYSSGVYYYKLVTSEYTETKKMVLIK